MRIVKPRKLDRCKKSGCDTCSMNCATYLSGYHTFIFQLSFAIAMQLVMGQVAFPNIEFWTVRGAIGTDVPLGPWRVVQ